MFEATNYLKSCCQKRLPWRSVCCRMASQSGPSKQQVKTSQGPVSSQQEVDEQTSTSRLSKQVDPVPIQSLNLTNQIEKIQKFGSFLGNLFLAKFDTDFLAWPVLLKSRKEFTSLVNQYEMVASNWNHLDKRQQSLEAMGFKKLHQLTVTEMVNTFEAIGTAVQRNSLASLSKNPSMFSSRQLMREVEQQNDVISKGKEAAPIISLLIHNALAHQLLVRSSNNLIKEKYLSSNSKIGFAFCEPQDILGSLPYPQWNSIANVTAEEDAWVLNGNKSKVFADDYDYYAIFCRTGDVPERRTRPSYLQDLEGRFIEEDDGAVGIFVPKNLVNIQDGGTDNFGLSYQNISFSDLLLSRDHHELISPQLDPINMLNIKGIGQISTAAVILGIAKQQLRSAYDYVINEKIGLSECDMIKKILTTATEKVYSIESTLYLTAAMFDAFGPEADCSLEAASVKILATELAHEIIHDMRTIYGHRYLLSSTVHDLINLFDSFLDGSINNRMFLALRGLKIFGAWRHDHIRKTRLGPLYPAYMLKSYIKQMRHRRDNEKLDQDLCGFLHPSMKESGDWLEYSIKRLEYAASHLLVEHGKEIAKKQVHLNRLAQIALDCFVMNCVLSRSSHAYCTGLRNGFNDALLAQSICMKKFIHVRAVMDEILGEYKTQPDYLIPEIHKFNLQNEGYFPTTTFDRLY